MNDNTTVAVTPYRPQLTFYHPNAKGTGCAMSLALHPAHDRTDGSIWVRAANQTVVGDRRGPNPTFPRFDWENALNVKLDFNDLTQMLQVFRGECESVNGDKGLVHRSPKGLTYIHLSHLLEPVAGYALEFYRAPAEGGAEQRARILFSPSEALGLSEAITGSLAVIAFGIPMVVPHDTAAYEARTREMRDGLALAS